MDWRQREHRPRPAATTSATCSLLCRWVPTKISPHLEHRVPEVASRLPQSTHAAAGTSDISPPFISLIRMATGSGRSGDRPGSTHRIAGTTPGPPARHARLRGRDATNPERTPGGRSPDATPGAVENPESPYTARGSRTRTRRSQETTATIGSERRASGYVHRTRPTPTRNVTGNPAESIRKSTNFVRPRKPRSERSRWKFRARSPASGT
jgi:hypothetical protein